MEDRYSKKLEIYNDFELLLGVTLPILLAIKSMRARNPLLLGRLGKPSGNVDGNKL